MIRRVAAIAGLVAAIALRTALPGRAQDAARGDSPAVQRSPAPFGVGEKFAYDVKFGFVKVGSGTMEVLGLETVRGRPAWHTIFTLKGGVIGYRVNDVFESWIDTATFNSLRFITDQEEGGRDRERHYEIYPDRQTYTENGKPEVPSARDPMDEGGFVYFARTLPLTVGRSYQFNRYFKPDRNPVRLEVLRTDRVKVPAGTFDAIVVRPIIKTKGIFSENGRAQIWFTNDARRLMVQMKTDLSFGTVNLYLRSYRPSTTLQNPSGGR